MTTSPHTPGPAPGAELPETTPWLGVSEHRAWLERGFSRVIEFANGPAGTCIRAEGGFHYPDAEGRPMPGRHPQLFLTARMGYVAAYGVRRGVPGADALLDHALASLLGFHRDPAYDGWLSEPGTKTPKSCYDHVHVALAASAALIVGHPDAPRLLDQVVEVIERRLWDEATQTLRESFSRDWSVAEEYRGANANMHGLEAFLALGEATGDPRWHRRGVAIAGRLCHRAAREHGWLLPEHYTLDWQPLPDYHRDQPDHPFRPYGATLGHSLEWARFLLDLDASPLLSRTEKPAWLREVASELAARALQSWAADGRDGLPYTVDWDGTVVSGLRLHWPVCEAIQATAQLGAVTGEPVWEGWYRRLWRYADRYFIDARGAWINEIDAAGKPAGTVWPGRPDVYHAGGALLGPLRFAG